MKWVRILVSSLGIALAAAGGADGATINYKLLINGEDLDTVTPAEVTPGEWFTVNFMVNVPDSDLTMGYWGGVLQYSVHLDDSEDALKPANSWVGPPPGSFPLKEWRPSYSVPPLANYRGNAYGDYWSTTEPYAAPGYDVVGHTGAIPPGDWPSNYGTFGAGSGVWSEVGGGDFMWNGGNTTLTLVPDDLSGQVIYGISGGENPTAAYGDSVAFMPEPMSMTLLSVGILALLRKRRG